MLSAKIGNRFPVNPCKYKINYVNLFFTFLPETVQNNFSPYIARSLAVLSEQKEERAFSVFGLNFPNPSKEGLPMKKVLTVTMDGIRYHASRPADCRHCFFWKNRKKGCVLGKENCYYLIEPPKGPSKCEGCPYKRAKPCVLVPCYKDLMAPLEKRGDAK